MPSVSDITTEPSVGQKPLVRKPVDQNAQQSTFSSFYETQSASQQETAAVDPSNLVTAPPAQAAQAATQRPFTLPSITAATSELQSTSALPSNTNTAPVDVEGQIAGQVTAPSLTDEPAELLDKNTPITPTKNQKLTQTPQGASRSDPASATGLANVSENAQAQIAHVNAKANQDNYSAGAKANTLPSLPGSDTSPKPSKIRAQPTETTPGQSTASADTLELATKSAHKIESLQPLGAKVTALPTTELAEGTSSLSSVVAGAPSSLQSPASQTFTTLQTPNAPVTTITASPAQVPGILSDAVSTAEKGNDKVVVQLDPPELGRVIIDFKFDANGLQNIVVTAESADALKQLRSMHFELIQALEQNGLTESDLSFNQETFDQQQERSQSENIDSEKYGSSPEPNDTSRLQKQKNERTQMMPGAAALDIKV